MTISYRAWELLSFVKCFAKELWQESHYAIISQESVELVTERRFSLVSFVLNFEFAQRQDGRNEVGTDSFLAENISEMDGRGFMIHL